MDIIDSGGAPAYFQFGVEWRKAASGTYKSRLFPLIQPAPSLLFPTSNHHWRQDRINKSHHGVYWGDMGSSDPTSPPYRRDENHKAGSAENRQCLEASPNRGPAGCPPERIYWATTNSSSCLAQAAEARSEVEFEPHGPKYQPHPSQTSQL